SARRRSGPGMALPGAPWISSSARRSRTPASPRSLRASAISAASTVSTRIGPMGIDLTGRQVLITGASSGIGRAAAKAFFDVGAVVLAVARSKDRLVSLQEELGGGERVATFATDVADGPAMEALARAVLASHGVPDIVVANAGIGLDARF